MRMLSKDIIYGKMWEQAYKRYPQLFNKQSASIHKNYSKLCPTDCLLLSILLAEFVKEIGINLGYLTEAYCTDRQQGKLKAKLMLLLRLHELIGEPVDTVDFRTIIHSLINKRYFEHASDELNEVSNKIEKEFLSKFGGVNVEGLSTEELSNYHDLMEKIRNIQDFMVEVDLFEKRMFSKDYTHEVEYIQALFSPLTTFPVIADIVWLMCIVRYQFGLTWDWSLLMFIEPHYNTRPYTTTSLKWYSLIRMLPDGKSAPGPLLYILGFSVLFVLLAYLNLIRYLR